MESNRWLLIAFLAGGVLIGATAYSVGLSQGAAHAAQAVASTADRGDVFWDGWHSHGWYGWGFPFGSLIALIFWIWIFRIVFWGFAGPWRSRWHRRWRYYDDYYDDPRRFDEWHRRAHERDPNRKSDI